MAKKTITINVLFKSAVIVNSMVCIVSLVVMCSAAAFANDSNVLAERLFSVCEKVFVMTAGAFVGLLGGRAAAPD
jgi:hypothetical protein